MLIIIIMDFNTQVHLDNTIKDTCLSFLNESIVVDSLIKTKTDELRDTVNKICEDEMEKIVSQDTYHEMVNLHLATITKKHEKMMEPLIKYYKLSTFLCNKVDNLQTTLYIAMAGLAVSSIFSIYSFFSRT